LDGRDILLLILHLIQAQVEACVSPLVAHLVGVVVVVVDLGVVLGFFSAVLDDVEILLLLYLVLFDWNVEVGYLLL